MSLNPFEKDKEEETSPVEEKDDDVEEVEIEVEKTPVELFKEEHKTAEFMVIGNIKEDGKIYQVGDPWKPSTKKIKGSPAINRKKYFIDQKLIKKVR